MNEKTPKFNAKMNEIFASLKPGIRVCRETGEIFKIRAEDIQFYKEMMVPPPTLAPWVRQRQRYGYSFSDELSKTKSALSGQEILANTNPESPMKIYANDEWWSDVWNPVDYGVDYNPNESFFEQLHNLRLRVPRPAKIQDKSSENSDWGIGGVNLKNCYMFYGGMNNENVLYSVSAANSRDSMEVFLSDDCELCYEIFDSKRCYKCRYLESSEDCMNCSFGFSLKNCEDCFGCVNLRYKKYCFFNEQLTKDEFEARIRNINLGSRKESGEWLKRFDEFRNRQAIQPNVRLKGAENSIGDNLIDCQNCYECFNVSNAQNCAYCFRCFNIRRTHDADGAVNAELCISIIGENLYNVKYCNDLIVNGRNLEYCELCYDIENCFGCVGLRNKKFHILNKEYREEEYWSLVDKIKCDMLARSEYGEGMPIKYGFYAYDTTMANYFYPLAPNEAQRLGVRFLNKREVDTSSGIAAETLLDDIAEANLEVIGKILICAETKRPFKIIKKEFEFYKKMNIPLPITSPKARRAEQYKKGRSPKFIKSSCAHCGKEIDICGALDKQRAKNVCVDCYLKVTL